MTTVVAHVSYHDAVATARFRQRQREKNLRTYGHLTFARNAKTAQRANDLFGRTVKVPGIDALGVVVGEYSAPLMEPTEEIWLNELLAVPSGLVVFFETLGRLVRVPFHEELFNQLASAHDSEDFSLTHRVRTVQR